MSIIQAIAIKRQKLLDGIEANEGDISLRIFEDFYPDEAHFIYELLQNAEDAGAAEVAFELTQHGCSFEHNGTRHFDERDIRGITGIFNSSKKEKTDKIGKFGVGFKSVFVYTDSPIVFSKNHSFKIVKLVLPVEVTPKKNLGQLTRFELPFNNPKKNVKAAHAEIKAGLEQLSETTLLFLKNTRHIKWRIDDKKGEILRLQRVRRRQRRNGNADLQRREHQERVLDAVLGEDDDRALRRQLPANEAGSEPRDSAAPATWASLIARCVASASSSSWRTIPW